MDLNNGGHPNPQQQQQRGWNPSDGTTPRIDNAFPGANPLISGGNNDARGRPFPGGDFAGDIAPAGGIGGMGGGLSGGGLLMDPSRAGNLMGPNHPSFMGNPGHPGTGGPGGRPGMGGGTGSGSGYGMRPRFDPYGPPGGPTDPHWNDLPTRPNPNNIGGGINNNDDRRVPPGGSGNPNPDHLRPPSNMDDMYM